MMIIINHKTYGTKNTLIDEEDFDLFNTYKWQLWSSPRHNSFYVVTSRTTFNNFKNYRLHRLITNAKNKEIVDHINDNALDNRKCNLRITNSSGNNMNARKRKNAKTSRYKGVSFYHKTNKWIAQIQFNKKKLNLGYFFTEIEAAQTYNKAAIKYFGEFACLNEVLNVI